MVMDFVHRLFNEVSFSAKYDQLRNTPE